MKAKSRPRAQVRVFPIAPRIEQDRLLRIMIVEWILREEKEKLRRELLVGGAIVPGPLTVETQGESIVIKPDSQSPR